MFLRPYSDVTVMLQFCRGEAANHRQHTVDNHGFLPCLHSIRALNLKLEFTVTSETRICSALGLDFKLRPNEDSKRRSDAQMS